MPATETIYMSIRLPRALVMRAQAVSERTTSAARLGVRIPDARTSNGSHVRRLSRRLVMLAALDIGLEELEARPLAKRTDPRQLEIP